MKELIAIQNELVVPKKHWNDHGKYFYRNCEDILEAAKPLCQKHNCLLTLTDDVVLLGTRFYVKSIATIKNSAGEIETAESAAREPDSNNAKMDGSQITGSASTYARKVALGGLFCLDDNKDADSGTGEVVEEKTSKAGPVKTTTKKLMTPQQKIQLKNFIPTLEKYGSVSTNKAITAIDTCLGSMDVSAEDAAGLIRRVLKTIEGANKNVNRA
jgi:hypothetical protein